MEMAAANAALKIDACDEAPLPRSLGLWRPCFLERHLLFAIQPMHSEKHDALPPCASSMPPTPWFWPQCVRAAFPATLLQAWWRSTNPSKAILKAGPMCWVACPAGLLADVEMDSMSDLVERRQKELHFTPPRVPVVPLRQELATHPMFRELPPQTLLRVGQQW